jgi:hypothetical protein
MLDGRPVTAPGVVAGRGVQITIQITHGLLDSSCVRKWRMATGRSGYDTG